MSYLGTVKIDNVEHLVGSTLYGTCATSASTQQKEVTLSNFDQIQDGVTVHVKFTYSNTHSTPTLKVGSTNAKPIYRQYASSSDNTRVGTTPATSWAAGSIVSFTYDGTNWIMNTASDVDENTTYTFAEGTTDGAFTVTPSGGSAQTVNVHNVMPTTGGTFSGNVSFGDNATLSVNTPTANTHAATKKYVDDALSTAMGTADAMTFQGTIGGAGTSPTPTITSLPTNSYRKGDTYKVVAAGQYGLGENCEIGDLIIAMSDGPDTGSTVVPSDWTIAQGNIDSGLYKGSNSFTDGHILVADGTNGQVKDGGAKATSISAASTSTDVPTSAAVASFVEGKGYVTSSGVTSVTLGIGLTTADGNAITSTGTVKAKLKSETALTADSSVATETSGRNYAIVTDGSGYLAVTVPWTDTNTKVTQTGITTDGEYAILLKNATGTSDETNGVNFGKTSGKLVTINPSTGILTAAGFSGALSASDIQTALGTDNTVTTALTFYHKSGSWKTLSINNTTTTIASVSGGVLTLRSTVSDSAALSMS